MIRVPCLSWNGTNRIARKVKFSPSRNVHQLVWWGVQQERELTSRSSLAEGIQPMKCIAKNAVTWSTTCIQQHNDLPTHSSTNMVGLVLFCNVFVVRLVPQTRMQKCFINSKQIQLHACLWELVHVRKITATAPQLPLQWSYAMTVILLSTTRFAQSPVFSTTISWKLTNTAELCLYRQASW